MTLAVCQIVRALVARVTAGAQLVRPRGLGGLWAHSELSRKTSCMSSLGFGSPCQACFDWSLHTYSDSVAGDSRSDDNESDAAIGYTGRLQLHGDASPILVWSAFFGPPSCSIGERN